MIAVELAQSALGWWQEAGVDVIVGEEPRDWLNPKAEAAPHAGAAAPAPLKGLPDTLESFQAWLESTDRLPFAAPSAPRLGASGDPASGLMILTDMPSAEDCAAGMLLAGEAGRLFDRMLAAIGRSRESVYLAALSPIRSPDGSLGAEAKACARIARHHIGLAAPRALLMLGDACARALTGSAMAAARGNWHEIDTPAGRIRALATIRPQELLLQPALKAHAWADLQLLMEGLKQ